MTGAFVRIQRDGHWKSVEIDELTQEELAEFEKTQGGNRGWLWTKFLVKWIQENIKVETVDATPPHNGVSDAEGGGK